MWPMKTKQCGNNVAFSPPSLSPNLHPLHIRRRRRQKTRPLIIMKAWVLISLFATLASAQSVGCFGFSVFIVDTHRRQRHLRARVLLLQRHLLIFQMASALDARIFSHLWTPIPPSHHARTHYSNPLQTSALTDRTQRQRSLEPSTPFAMAQFPQRAPTVSSAENLRTFTQLVPPSLPRIPTNKFAAFMTSYTSSCP